MCTVSFVQSNGKIIITSNRDEKVIRPIAIEPKLYLINSKKITFPKDPQAGGTWYAVNENGTVLVLLNGAEEKHQLESNYRKSRGLIVLDVISSQSPKDFWTEIDLKNIEPFTLILFQENQLFQLRWNGKEKSKTKLDLNKKHIWSSSTLYPKTIREERSSWFYDFLDSKKEVSENDLYNFHRNTQNEDHQNGLVINRNDQLKTMSITQTVLEKNKVVLSHYDLLSQKEFTNTFITL